ncbi:MAG: ATP-binding cassette domain-containing protein [Xanthomonadales bacterium]|nr:ATP-binding cassette domain-containing protein [Xanthomonadales bacterium]
MAVKGKKLLEVEQLEVVFNTRDGEVKAVNKLDFSMQSGETLAIVGESGSGKSQTALAIMKLLAANGKTRGAARFYGRNLLEMTATEINEVRGEHIAMIFQDPTSSLNPYMTIEEQMLEVLMRHRKMSRKDARLRVLEMLTQVDIPDPERRIRQYPHEYSGGMQQRVLIAMGLLCQPELLIADEPTTALDVTVQDQIKRLMRELKEKFNTSILLITHDLGVVAGLADKVLVMYAGQLVESAPVDEIFYRPRHPYTAALLKAVPRLDQVGDYDMHPIPGNPPNLLKLPKGCAFRNRCEMAFDACAQMPEVREVAPGHKLRCFLDGGALK